MPDDPARNRCPVCGWEFDPVNEHNVCPNHQPTELFYPQDLIAADDDCAYDI